MSSFPFQEYQSRFEDEAERRVNRLRNYNILHTPEEEPFNRLTRVGTDLFDVPICYISFLDDEKEWFKSIEGSSLDEVPLKATPSPVLAGKEAPMHLDLEEEVKLNGNAQGPFERMQFMAGAPIVDEDPDGNVVLGVFGVLDQNPLRSIDELRKRLRELANQSLTLTKRRTLEDHLDEIDRDLFLKEQALDSIDVGISIADVSQKNNPLIYVNDGFCEITGYERSEVLGRNCRFLQGPETDPETVQTIREALRAGESVSLKIRNYRKDGQPFWNQLSLNPLYSSETEPQHFVGIQRDVTTEVQLRQKLEQRATYDELTGLLRRSELMDQLDESFRRIRSNTGTEGVLGLIDLDHFKRINDQYGHLLGDHVLESIGDLIRNTFDETAIRGRYGGEEFCVLLPESEMEEAQSTFDQIRQQIADETFMSGKEQEPDLTASVGLTRIHPDDPSLTEVIRRADEALYRSKENGRNRTTQLLESDQFQED